MWQRRVELKITEHLYNGFRFAEGLPLFEARLRCLPEAAEGLKATAQDGISWLDAQIAGCEFIAGDAFTLADIMLFAFLDFGASVGQPIDPANTNILGWYERMKSRPSATAN